MKRITELLKQKKNVLVTSHTNPDGDAIGALLATGLALNAMGKTVLMYNESPIPAVYRFLPSVDMIRQQIPTGTTFDAAVVLDCGTLERVGGASDRIGKLPLIINIDHHITNNGFGDYQLVDADACATAEIVYRVIKQWPLTIGSAMAAAIYTGILTDTGSFRFSNTTQAAFAICEEMVQCGVDPYQVSQHVYGTYSLGRIKLLNLALDSLEISPNGRLSIMTLTQEMMAKTATQPEDADGLINYARRIQDVKVAALIHQVSVNGDSTHRGRHEFHISLRSDGSVDVAQIAAAFGGGGHASAAGFSATATLGQLKAQLFELSETTPGLCNIN